MEGAFARDWREGAADCATWNRDVSPQLAIAEPAPKRRLQLRPERRSRGAMKVEEYFAKKQEKLEEQLVGAVDNCIYHRSSAPCSYIGCQMLEAGVDEQGAHTTPEAEKVLAAAVAAARKSVEAGVDPPAAEQSEYAEEWSIPMWLQSIPMTGLVAEALSAPVSEVRARAHASTRPGRELAALLCGRCARNSQRRTAGPSTSPSSAPSASTTPRRPRR